MITLTYRYFAEAVIAKKVIRYMYRGFVKLHRVFVDWEWYKKPNMVHFFTHCLLRANHKRGLHKGIQVENGQFISGRKKLSEETGLTEQQIRTCIKYLKSTRELTTTPTKGIDGIYTVFTLNNWKKYQHEERPTSTATTNPTERQPRVNHGLTTNKNVKNEKNEKEIEKKPETKITTFEEFERNVIIDNKRREAIRKANEFTA